MTDQRRAVRRLLVGAQALIVTLAAAPLAAQYGATNGEWAHYSGDRGSTKYSALDQIDRDNFDRLEVVWRWESADSRLPEGASRFEPGHFRGTPLMFDGVVYVPTGLAQVAALDAATGEELWLYNPESYGRGVPVHSLAQIRGLESWTDSETGERRIVIATGGRQLVSIDAGTGVPDPEFGRKGVVDLTQDLGREVNPRHLGHSAPVIIVRDTIIVGSAIFDFPAFNRAPPGHVRAYDIRTGELRWRFNSIPQEGEPHTETWENEAWRKAGNTNVWSMMSADPELGYVYLPFGTPTNDYYGGHRHGDNVYAESIVCVDVETGEVVWHFQTVHHGIWDYDLATAPNLMDIVVDGREIKAVAQASKQGMTYVFDRATGEPIWPIVEAPVNYHSSVPGEKLAKTQPFPTRPPPFETLGIDIHDLIDFTPELRAEAIETIRDYVIGPIFTPLVVHGVDGKLGTIQAPGTGGGANWAGASADPETGMLYVPSQVRPRAVSLTPPDAARSDWHYTARTLIPAPTVQGLPLLKPPYRRITAIDMNRGEHAWQIPVGEGPTHHPAIKHLDLGPLGSQHPMHAASEGGILLTKTLLITFLARVDELAEWERRYPDGGWLQAYDKATGDLLSQVEVDRSLHSAPMTYMADGRQFIVIAGGGSRGQQPEEPAELVAFALPE
ncbi:MAG: PQQ-binding-like beta-propeller repeat protein [Acidobacteriota bacterium]|nr:PQQ-binding-like beta-propeller repeat protein [Acidobacteriota bacterium]